MKNLSAQDIRAFRGRVYRHYEKYGRSFPWRTTSDPYHILVSEIMLQQTQVKRVKEKYRLFLKKFPTVRSLSHAPLSRVVKIWHGLGYNRRALYLRNAARRIVIEYNGKIPGTEKELRTLPGIGKYTAAAIRAFAFNEPTIFLETNIRTVYIDQFYPRSKNVHDKDILHLVAQTLDSRNARKWYSALMDYGAMIKRVRGNKNIFSVHYSKQKAFKGSDRQIRGQIIRLLIRGKKTRVQLCKASNIEGKRLSTILKQLHREGMISEKNGVCKISDS